MSANPVPGPAPNEIYKNSPLAEVFSEVRFNPMLTSESRRDKFHERVKDAYPYLAIPQSNQDPYAFTSRDQTWSIFLSPILFAVSCKKYGGFQAYKKECLRLFSIFGDVFQSDKLVRFELRYVNMIPFGRQSGNIPLKNYLNIEINLATAAPSTLKASPLIFISQLEKGGITTRVEPVMSPGQTQEALILDLDYANDADLSFKDLDAYFEEGHSRVKAHFEGLVTDRYRSIMRGA
jgi:uncharacterized protein (TIGR04255 family)